MAYANTPLLDQLENINIPMCFIYGEFDHMERESVDKLVEQKKIKAEVYSVTNSDHHLYV
jgi:pimeloyl-ACP methyl ester carboxylesterase